MFIKQLQIVNIRNLASITIDLSPHFNFFFGENGSGKTSILESIFLLSMGRSFRTQYIAPLIQANQNFCLTTAHVLDLKSNQNHYLSIKKNTTQKKEILIDGCSYNNQKHLSELLPVQLIASEIDLLPDATAKEKRAFLDWGVFHVEHQFWHDWKQLKHTLRQRNALLKKNKVPSLQKKHHFKELLIWNDPLIAANKKVNGFREKYFNEFKQFLKVEENQILDIDWDISYDRGWPKDKMLEDLFLLMLEEDCQKGFTRYGAHRADIHFRILGKNAAQYLSRGQKKLLSSYLKLVQVLFLKKKVNRSSLFLLDDFPSEMDDVNKSKFYQALVRWGGQVFLTGVNENQLITGLPEVSYKMFHVEHGKVCVIN